MVDISSTKEQKECLPQDEEVEAKALVLHIPDIVAELLFPGDRIPSVHLRPACDPRFDVMAALLLFRITLKVAGKERSRTDKAHVSPHDVPEAWEFVQAGSTQPRAQRCDSFVVWEKISVRVEEVAHRAELVESKGCASPSSSLLGKQHRTTQAPTNQSRENEKQGKRAHQTQSCDEDVEHSFDPVARSLGWNSGGAHGVIPCSIHGTIQ